MIRFFLYGLILIFSTTFMRSSDVFFGLIGNKLDAITETAIAYASGDDERIPSVPQCDGPVYIQQSPAETRGSILV